MVNLIEFRHLVEKLDQIATPAIVDRGLRKAKLNRQVLRMGPGFIPYATEAILLETVARAIGDPLLGARLGQSFDYNAYGAYADHVLGAPTLQAALTCGTRALPVLHAGSQVTFRNEPDHVVLGFNSGLWSVVGHKHIDLASIFILSNVIHHFLGAQWVPDWIEISSSARTDLALTGVRIVAKEAPPAFAVRKSDLQTKNPQPLSSEAIVTSADLTALMNVTPQENLEQHVYSLLSIQLAAGDTSIDAVAQRLNLGPRTLQRRLQTEGTSFRDVKNQFNADRALQLVSGTNQSIDDIAFSLGFSEPNSFRRMFRKWTGMSPQKYRGHSTDVVDAGF